MLTAILFALTNAITVSPSPPPPPTGGYAPPQSVGGPHICPETQYPVPALQTGTEGKTILHFTITTEGKVSDVTVNASSGNADLDIASANCARDWLYRPAKRDGVAASTPWLAAVVWKIGVTPIYAELDHESLLCVKADDVAYDELKKAPLHAVVRVHFEHGAVSSATLVGTSGDPDLDPRVVACYRSMSADLTADVPDGDELFVAMLPPLF